MQINNYKEYFDLISPKYITWDFYEKYINYNIPFGVIGDIVDCRTYRRFIPQLNRRERAIEAFLRVVEYNIKLVNHLQPFDVLQEEAELMFDSLVNLKMLPSNRSRWTGGTKSVELNPSSIFNCSFCAINRLEVFGEIFELLCLGVGVGYRIFYRDINALPNIKNRKFHLVHKEYTPLPKQLREEHTTYYERDGVLRVTIGDSRQGWKDSLMLMINVSFHDKYKNITSIEFDYNSVRPFGERILGFGGTASGHDALKSILVDVFDIITKCPDDRLRTLDCLDIPCAIARGVVAGSSRRSALMVWFEQDDELCANAKVNIPSDKTYRYQANITSCVGSLYYDEFLDFLIDTKPTEQQVVAYIDSVKPPFEYFQRRFKQMESLGEPGINNFLWLVYKRWLGVIAHRPDEVDVLKYLGVATNPCLSGDTLVKTKSGDIAIKDLVGKEVEIWDGVRWVLIDNFRVTGYNKPVFTVKTPHGNVTATSYHKFVLADNTEKELCNLVVGDKLKFSTLEGDYKSEIYAIEPAGVEDKVYCCTVPTNHRFTLANNMLIGQCSEIIGTIGLDGKSGSYCNLSVNNLLSFVKLDANNKYYFDYQDCKKTTELITRIGLRQTEVVIPMSGWNETQREERLLGVDTTCGFQDVCDAVGWSYDSAEASELRIKLHKWANDEATKYAAELNVPRPLLVTTSKPNGTTAQVLGTASGIHWNWSKYYLRRIGMTSTDPLALTLLDQGFKCYPGVYDVDKVDSYIGEIKSLHKYLKYATLKFFNKLDTFHRLEIFDLLSKETQRTIIDSSNEIKFEFPVKSNANVSANDVSALDQLESQRLFSVENTDHMPSITITVKKNEWSDVTKWVYDNWTNGFNTAAFLSYDETTYPLLPFQTITEKEYQHHLEPIKHNAVVNSTGNISFKLDTDLLDYYEALLQAQKDDNDLIVEACEVGGSCPTR